MTCVFLNPSTLSLEIRHRNRAQSIATGMFIALDDFTPRISEMFILLILYFEEGKQASLGRDVAEYVWFRLGR